MKNRTFPSPSDNTKSSVTSTGPLRHLLFIGVYFSAVLVKNVVTSAAITVTASEASTLNADGSSKYILQSSFPDDFFSLEERRSGAVVVHFLVSIYLFFGLYVLCERYFVPAVESICKNFKVSSDVAGATFMAMSTSAPELFTNFIGTFVTKGDLGVGTIVGSTVFNILIVAAVCGITTVFSSKTFKTTSGRKGIQLEWWPLSRDSFFYILGIGALIYVLDDQRVFWYEALGMLILYALYVIVLWKSQKLKGFFEGCYFKIKNSRDKKRHKISIYRPSKLKRVSTATEVTPLLSAASVHPVASTDPSAPSIAESDSSTETESSTENSEELSVTSNEYDELLVSNAFRRTMSTHDGGLPTCGACLPPRHESATCLTWVFWIASFPLRLAYSITIPDCRHPKWYKWYPLTLVMCILWTGVLCYVVSWMMTIIGETLDIPESVTGLTFLAVGTSLPEVFSSIIVAKQGLGSMAFSSSVGSNTFDILLCLGLPWLIEGSRIANHIGKNFIEIQSQGLAVSSILMIAAIVILYLLLACNGYVLDRRIGFTSLVMYVIFLTIAILLELDVFH